jgi:alcohol dehydrogenase class IV
MKFEFASAGRILFGPGRLAEVGKAAAELGNRALVVTGSTVKRSQKLARILEDAGVEWRGFSTAGEPTVPMVEEGIAYARQENCDLVIGFGGGSALDAGKAIGIMLTNHGSIYDYLEVIGEGIPIANPGLPFLAIPTTAGTGTEVTRNAVLGSPEHRVKVSLRSSLMLPNLALIDPELTYDLPGEITAFTGMDALTQLIEPYVSSKNNPMIDPLCLDGIIRVSRSLRRAFSSDSDPDARQEMSLASLYGGLALSNAKLGAVHGFAGPIGGMVAAPHGAICARLLAPVMEVNIRTLRMENGNNHALQRYATVARTLTGDEQANAEDSISWLRSLADYLNIPGLNSYGIHQGDFRELVDKATVASSMQGNPVKLDRRAMEEILEMSI